VYRASGMHAVYVGDEAVVDCGSFHLRGGDRKGLRQAAQRVERNGYTVTFHDARSIDDALRHGLSRLLATSRRGAAERGFSMTLGRPFDTKDRSLLLAVSHAPDGRPVAFCQFVPQAGGRSWSLDVMRSERHGHPNGLLDHVIVETIGHLAAREGAMLCLNFATMRNVLTGDGRSIGHRALRRVLTRASASMQIESLLRFNAKFFPTWHARYVVFSTMIDLPSAALAIVRAESIFELPVIGRFVRPRPEEPADLVTTA
jgi:lysyl-tRNA synthetase, class II